MLLIGGSLKETALSIKVSKSYYSSRVMFKIRKRQFVQAFMSITGWCHNMIYVVNGDYIPELNMIAFRLGNAEKLMLDV